MGTIRNDTTKTTLVLKSDSTDGTWDEAPPAQLAPGQSGSFKVHRGANLKASIIYEGDGGASSVTMSIAMPLIGRNSFGCDAIGALHGQVVPTDGGGYKATPVWTVSD